MAEKKTFSDLINGDTPVLVDFFAEWCGPCKTQAPILDELKAKVGGKAVIIKIDVDRNPQAAAHYQVQGVPTLMLFRQGKMLWRQSGVAPVAMLENLIQQHSA